MIKVLIADDEVRIRRGIKGIMNWQEFGFEIVGEAEDGEMALEVAKEKRPDLFLLDICMPFLNGLDLISEINSNFDNPIIIIISGHDEFKYAQMALQLKVFDYILKPIEREGLKKTILRAKNEIVNKKNKRAADKFTRDQLTKSNIYLKENFFGDWVKGNLKNKDITTQFTYFNIKFSDQVGVIVIKTLDKKEDAIGYKWNSELLCYGIKNIAKELLLSFHSVEIFTDSKKQVVIISDIIQVHKWNELKVNIEINIKKYLKVDVIVEQELVRSELKEVPNVYSSICNKINEKLMKTPIVLEAQKYIERNYCNETLSMAEIADNIGISQTYLTRLLKKELGMTFIDYLTFIRIKNAMILMEDPTIKMYEIAELVGYSTQHYFSNVFKKHTGIAPIDYKRGVRYEQES